MHLIASYPMTEQTLTPYIGKPVMGITHHGDRFIGTLQSCKDGHVYLTPIQPGAASPAAVKSLKKQNSNHPNIKKKTAKNKQRTKISKQNLQQAHLSFFGPGFAIPLLTIGALFTAPFFI